MLNKVISSALLFLVLAQGAVAIPGPGPAVVPCGSPPDEIFCPPGFRCCGRAGGNFCLTPNSDLACLPPNPVTSALPE
ncbi:hypothetical protein FB451DRAFT_1553973 [Mycena latifolia]|nr:hypothetical protein FB451DRAFT_1553973 [Mycena latifolia]